MLFIHTGPLAVVYRFVLDLQLIRLQFCMTTARLTDHQTDGKNRSHARSLELAIDPLQQETS